MPTRPLLPLTSVALLCGAGLLAAACGCQRATELVRLPDASAPEAAEGDGAGPMRDFLPPMTALGARAESSGLAESACDLPRLSFVLRLAADSWEVPPRGGSQPQFPSNQAARAVSPAPTNPPAPLDVMSFNMEHRDRPEELAVMADHLRKDLPRVPAFLLLQEVQFTRYGSQSGWRNTAETLGDLLGYHTSATKRTSDSEGVAIVSRYPFAYYAERHLEAQTSPLLLGFRRVSVMGEFEVPAVGRVRVVNVHLTNWATEHHVRKGQIRETLEWIARRERQMHADVTILGGDFNADRDSSEMAVLDDMAITGGLEYRDFNGTQPTRGGEGHPSVRIDYIFIAATDRALAMRGEQRLWLEGLKNKKGNTFWLSDHVPVLHAYAVSGQPATMTAAAGE